MDNNNETTQIEPVVETSSEELITDIFPLLGDYIFGEFTITSADTIMMKMDDGKQFKLTITEVK